LDIWILVASRSFVGIVSRSGHRVLRDGTIAQGRIREKTGCEDWYANGGIRAAYRGQSDFFPGVAVGSFHVSAILEEL